MLTPILIGKLTMVILSLALCLLCYCEYARATGLFRERAINNVVIIGIILIHFAALDNNYRLFVAVWPVTAAFIVASALIIGICLSNSEAVEGVLVWGSLLARLYAMVLPA